MLVAIREYLFQKYAWIPVKRASFVADSIPIPLSSSLKNQQLTVTVKTNGQNNAKQGWNFFKTSYSENCESLEVSTCKVFSFIFVFYMTCIWAYPMQKVFSAREFSKNFRVNHITFCLSKAINETWGKI